MTFPRQLGAEAPARQCRPTLGTRGFSLIEVVVMISIMAIVATIAIPKWKATRMNILAARRQTMANLRLARGNALTKAVHYQVSFPDAGHVALSAMYQSPANSGNWVVDTTKVQTSALPSGTQVSASNLSTTVQFNTRGMVTNATSLVTISLTDSFSSTKTFQLWPSGQMNET